MLIMLITFKIPCYKRISRSKLDPFFIYVYGLMSNEPNGSSLIFFFQFSSLLSWPLLLQALFLWCAIPIYGSSPNVLLLSCQTYWITSYHQLSWLEKIFALLHLVHSIDAMRFCLFFNVHLWNYKSNICSIIQYIFFRACALRREEYVWEYQLVHWDPAYHLRLKLYKFSKMRHGLYDYFYFHNYK